ncbi:hypothetical protein TNCV_1309161 [Trichonephila clavipes]|nr:hypothetical protein TNCV_1309161 [Trichonephila clavipes]
MERKKGIRTATDSVQSGWPDVVSSRSRVKRHLRAQAQLSESRTETLGLLRKREKKRAEKDGGSRAGVPVENSWKPIC